MGAFDDPGLAGGTVGESQETAGDVQEFKEIEEPAQHALSLTRRTSMYALLGSAADAWPRPLSHRTWACVHARMHARTHAATRPRTV